jgi:hypothetical protein
MPSPVFNRRDQLRRLYGFDFPDDFFRFWEFANRLKPLDPLSALSDSLHIRLVGPFEVLSGRFDHSTPRLSPLLHWRYYLDPPEFFTVLAGAEDRLHWGYYLDDPTDGRSCVASYFALDVFELSADGDNLFEAVRLELEARHDQGRLEPVDLLRQEIQKYATAERPERDAGYVDQYQGKVARNATVIASTPEDMWVVAPPETYRPLSLSDKKLRSLIRKESDPIALVVEARQALRDGFPATALKLGKELWPLHGDRKAEYAHELIDAAYAALGREVLRNVLRVHREHRNLPSVDIFDAESRNGNGAARSN